MHTDYHITLQRWHWGMNTWHIIEKKLMEAQLFKDNHVNVIRRGNEGAKDELLCFDDLYLSARTGHWLQGMDNLISFRKEAAVVTGETYLTLNLTPNPNCGTLISILTPPTSPNSNG